MRQVVLAMGIPISLDIPTNDNTIFKELEALFQEVDQEFSTYKKNSAVTQYQLNQLPVSRRSIAFTEVMKACQLWEDSTHGYFSAWFSGIYNPTGYVKGWALQRAHSYLLHHGYTTFLLNAGGDIIAQSDGTKQWHIGIQNPFHSQKTIGSITFSRGAIATSGTYERGNHIINPITKKPATTLCSATIYGPHIVDADVYATTCIAMGASAITFMEKRNAYEALLVRSDGTYLQTSRFLQTG